MTESYPTRLKGAAFTAEIGFKQLRFWLPLEQKRRTINTSNVESVQVTPNGYLKIVVRFGKDLIIPATQSEAVPLLKALNGIISEIQAVEQRRREAAVDPDSVKTYYP